MNVHSGEFDEPAFESADADPMPAPKLLVEGIVVRVDSERADLVELATGSDDLDLGSADDRWRELVVATAEDEPLTANG